MWWEWCLWTHAVPRQHRTLLVCRPKRTGDPWDSLWTWQQTNVWVNPMCFNSGEQETVSHCVLTDQICMIDGAIIDQKTFPNGLQVPPRDFWLFQPLCPAGIDHSIVPPPVGPTPRPDVHPLPPGTHLLFAQSGRIDHVPLEGYDMKKDDAKTVLHLPVSPFK